MNQTRFIISQIVEEVLVNEKLYNELHLKRLKKKNNADDIY